MSRPRSGRDRGWLRVLCAGLVMIAAGMSLSACGASPTKTLDYGEPAKLKPIEGKDLKRVEFSAEGARQVGLLTTAVREEGGERVVPSAALLYDAEGNTFVYTSPERLAYVREYVEVDRVDDGRVVLSDSPPAGTEIVTVGAAEVYGTEFEVDH